MPFPPALSVVLVTPDRYDRLRPVIQHLRRQTARDRIEVIIAAPRVANLHPDESELAEFASFHLVEIGPIRSAGEPRAMGARAATAPVIVFGEDHCWPEPDWAEALIETHRQPWGGVGPTLVNGNPGSIVSWASFLLNFGPCVERSSSGVCNYIPTHNSSFKADLLHVFGDRLGFAMEAEALLHTELISDGGQLFMQTKARAAHINISTFPFILWEQFWGACYFWSARARWQQWSLLRRCIWAAGTPGLIILRVPRALKHAGRIGFPRHRLPALFFVLTSGALSITCGAFCGILIGRSERSADARVNMEFHRCRYLRPEDKHLLPDD